MDKTGTKELEEEYLKITKMILKGMTIPMIANNLNYSESTVSNRLNDLFKRYSATNRFEFIYNFFSRIIQKYKVNLKNLYRENELLKNYIYDIKTIVEKTEKNSVLEKSEFISKTEF